MAIGDFKVFDYTLDGLHLSVTATENAAGTVDMVVTQIGAGKADINALYWNDSDNDPADGYSFGYAPGATAAKGDSSLNMNGVQGEVWDGGIKISSTGLGPNASVAKAGYLDHDGDTYSVTANVSLAQLETLGIRATSTSTPGGSIKAVDDGELHVAHLQTEKVYDFEQDNVDGGGFEGFFTQTVPIDWDSANGLVEVSGGTSNYGHQTNYGANGTTYVGPGPAGEKQYLDTAASAGNINITTENGADITEGAKAHIDISVAAQFLEYHEQHYETSDAATFDLVFNNQTVHTFTLAEIAQHTNTEQDGQAFVNFSFDNADAAHGGAALVGIAGDDHISIVAHGQQDQYVGFSVDHVVLSEWVY